jgi:hypothetical protein
VSTPPTLPSGWFPDPHGRHEHRWFNGSAWTADVADGGQRFVDPLGAAPASTTTTAGRGPGTGNGLATAAITCGLLALLIAWIPILVIGGFVLAVVAVVTGWRGIIRSRTTLTGRSTAIAGLVTGGAAIGLSVVGAVLTVSAFREVIAFVEPEPNEATLFDCWVEPGELFASGSVENTGDEVADYTVYVVVTEPGDVRDLVTTLDDVAPGDVRRFETSRAMVTEGRCEARLVVHGPLPWGVEMERVNEQ